MRHELITNATLDQAITLLGVWAHPDDESYLSAVAMHRVAKAGGRVVLATATRGELGGSSYDPRHLAELRERELRTAMSVLGVDDVRVLGHADGDCANVDFLEATQSIAALIADVRPDVVMTFGPDGMTNHPDHIAVSGWTTAATVAVGHEHLLYATFTEEFARHHGDLHARLGVWMGEGQPPAIPAAHLDLHIVPTPRELELKRRALHAHQSQIAPLTTLIGVDAFDGWWVDEFFRRPTSDELRVFDFTGATPCLAR